MILCTDLLQSTKWTDKHLYVLFAGFKYIGKTAQDLADEGYTVPFGYEEAM